MREMIHDTYSPIWKHCMDVLNYTVGESQKNLCVCVCGVLCFCSSLFFGHCVCWFDQFLNRTIYCSTRFDLLAVLNIWWFMYLLVWGIDLVQEWQQFSLLHHQYWLGTCSHLKGLGLQRLGSHQLLWNKYGPASVPFVASSWKHPPLLRPRYNASSPVIYLSL